MLTVIGLLKMKPSPHGEQHGERPFWREHGERYLNAWLVGVERYVPQPHRVVVMTDTHIGIPDVVATRQLDITVDAPGYFAKLNMFREEVSEGKCLYMDLDNVLCGDLSALCALTPDPLIMMDDRAVPRLPNGSVILFDAARCRWIWAQYCKRPRQYDRDFLPEAGDYSHAYDQAFIAEYLDESGHEVRFFQDMLPPDYCLNALTELPQREDWSAARLIFGSGVSKNGKPHTSSHPAFALR